MVYCLSNEHKWFDVMSALTCIVLVPGVNKPLVKWDNRETNVQVLFEYAIFDETDKPF